MKTIILIGLGWFIVSVIVALFVGQVFKRGKPRGRS
jgi:hypothetical protein